VVNTIDVRVAVIGGGISAVGEFVLKAAEDTMRARILKPHRAEARVIRATLGNRAGILGAASLVLHA
jgi:glucokinase